MKASIHILVFLVCLSMWSCSRTEMSETSAEGPPSEEEEVGPYGPPLGVKADVVRSVTIKASGGVSEEISGKKGDGKTGLIGGCNPADSFANFGFEIGESMGGRAGVAFTTEDRIATGQTGEIKLDWVLFEVVKLDGTNIDAKSFMGDGGTLTLITHNAAAGNRRMIGTIIGKNLEPKDGTQAKPVDVEVQFDAEFSCGVQ